MTDEFTVYMLLRLPPGMFGETYVITTGTEVSKGECDGEYYILTQRPQEALRSRAFHFSGNSLPAELGVVDSKFAQAEALRQSELDLFLLLEARAAELGRPDLACLPFELQQRTSPFVGCWMHGRFVEQLKVINRTSRCPALVRYLDLLQQVSIIRQA
jgi:hypothetical protein